ncbi:MAG: glycosyl hydrolase family 28-related protein [Bacteroidota bacterium]
MHFVQDYINGKWFGAVGDGITDDTFAVQSAVDFALRYRVGSILYPAGEYIITQTIQINLSYANQLNPIIKGVGKNATIFKSGVFDMCIPFYEATYSELPLFQHLL